MRWEGSWFMREGIILVFVFLGFSHFAESALIKYVDNTGRLWVVDRIEAVPQRYRVEKPKPALNPPGASTSFAGAAAVPGQQANALTPAISAAQKGPIEVFVTSQCPVCKQLEQFLQKNGIIYNRYDLESDQEGKAKYSKMGYSSVPILTIGPKVLEGFDPDQILAELGR